MLEVRLHVNGVERRLLLRPWTTLLDALREYLDLTGNSHQWRATSLAEGIHLP
jgi:aerobic-type carbon monoxide dehydrogenase small subunit (CoxS/CutS family)